MRGFETVREKGGGHSSERAKPYAKDPAWVATSEAVLRVVGVLSDNGTEQNRTKESRCSISLLKSA